MNATRGGRRRLTDSVKRATIAGHVLDGMGDWIYSLALVVLAYQLTGRLAVAAAALLFQATGRLVGMAFCDLATGKGTRSLAIGTGLLRAALVASLIAVTERDQIWMVMAVAALMGLTSPVAEVARRTVDPIELPIHHPRNLAARLLERLGQVTMMTGTIASGLLIAAWSERTAFAIAALSILAATLLLVRERRQAATTAQMPDGTWRRLDLISPRHMRAFQTVMLALAGCAALGIAIRVILVEVVLDRHDDSEFMYGLFVALAGAGAFAGPLSVPRLLSKIPPQMILAGLLIALAVAALALRVANPLALLAPVILGCGIAAITAEQVSETVTRRLVPDQQLDGALRLMAVALAAGQALALAAVIALDRSSGLTATVVAFAGGGTLLAGFALLSYMGGSRSRGIVPAGQRRHAQMASATDD